MLLQLHGVTLQHSKHLCMNFFVSAGFKKNSRAVSEEVAETNVTSSSRAVLPLLSVSYCLGRFPDSALSLLPSVAYHLKVMQKDSEQTHQ